MTFRPTEHAYRRDIYAPLLATLDISDPGEWWAGPDWRGEVIDRAAAMAGAPLADLRYGGRRADLVLRRMHFCHLLARRGWTPQRIADVLQCDRSSVSYLLRRYATVRAQ